MSGGAFRTAGAAMLVLLMAFTFPSLASAASATQQRDDHANHDRWARASTDHASPTSDSSSDDEDADDSSHHHHANGSETQPRHKGELNGKLHMGEWS